MNDNIEDSIEQDWIDAGETSSERTIIEKKIVLLPLILAGVALLVLAGWWYQRLRGNC